MSNGNFKMQVEMRTRVNGDKIWHAEGFFFLYHREDGPAIEYADGAEAWYFNDVYYSRPQDMPLNLFLAYVKWELKKHGN